MTIDPGAPRLRTLLKLLLGLFLLAAGALLLTASSLMDYAYLLSTPVLTIGVIALALAVADLLDRQ